MQLEKYDILTGNMRAIEKTIAKIALNVINWDELTTKYNKNTEIW